MRRPLLELMRDGVAFRSGVFTEHVLAQLARRLRRRLQETNRMTCLKKDQIGNKGLSRVIGNYERPVYKKIGLDFNETLCCPFPPRYRDRSALHSVLVRPSLYDFFLHRDFDSGSSLQTNVTRPVGCRTESKERVAKIQFRRPHQ